MDFFLCSLGSGFRDSELAPRGGAASWLMDSPGTPRWRFRRVRSTGLLLMVVAISFFCMLHCVPASRIDRSELREGVSSGSSAAARGLMSTQTDTEALLQFKLQCDPLGKLVDWNSNGGDGVCTWFGVSCASERVTKVQLRGADLVGAALAVSSLITSLDKLQYLDLSGNNFHGNLSSFGSPKGTCGSLETVILASNSLTGSIPSDLLSCGTILHLDLSHNSLSGDLPQGFFPSCGSLQALDLSYNRLAASLPPSIALCSSLQLLNLSSNHFVGRLPLDLLSLNCDSCSTETVPRLQTLDLSRNNLSGTISDRLFTSCGSLISLDLSSNSFSGEIPASIENCNSLQQLNFSHNNLESRLPVSLGRLTSMSRLDISNNRIVGPIPPELGQICLTLLHLDLSVNNISGTIPSSFASCYSLQTLNLTNNNLSGSFPEDIVSKLRNVENLLFAFNKFTGPMPVSVTSCSNLKVLDLSSNRIKSQMPPEICHQSLSLEKLLVSNNEIWGEVPAGLANCSRLQILDLSFNSLQGTLPEELGSMSNLESLTLWSNRLTGEIPARLGHLSNLRMLILNNNALSGQIPLELSNCTLLQWLCLSNNKLTGTIPPFIGRMSQLTLVELGNNNLYGNIPNEFANGSKFLWLDLNSNHLSGTIPPGLGRHAIGPLTRLSDVVFAFVRNLGTGCRGLGSLLEFAGITQDALDLAHSSCNSTRLYFGPSLVNYPDYSSVQVLDLSYNSLEGPIPDDMGYLTALQMLSLGHNQLVGVIPATFSNLRSIGVLDLSYNKLEGGIWPLSNCSFLVQIDVSNNNLSGQIPSTGQLSTAPAAGFLNNPNLCGEPLPPCDSNQSDGNTSDNCITCINNNRLSVFPWANSIVLAILISVALVCMIFVWALMVRSKGKHKDTDLLGTLQASCHGTSTWNLGTDREPLSINVATFERPLRKLTFAQLVEATNGFSQESLIGIGGFGEVYKAELKDGSFVAIKKLLQFSFQGDREFTAEMETLGKIKHRNLVPLLGYCKVGEERLLVYEYMHGGSLDDMLHDEARKEKLTWDLRKQIARGAARGLAFLHHNCIPHIIHRDMKSSNVLLDRNLEARVSDFGMARLISALDTHLSVSTLAGTPGYVPPEYYQSFRCSTKGDVYSFGVILLELLTGKRPTDKEEFEDSNLVGWVRQHLDQKKCMEVLDPHLKGVGAEHEMMYYLKIACDCLDDHPSRRPSMQQVVSMFKELQAQENQN